MIRVELQSNPAFRGWDVWITKELSDGGIKLAKPIELVFDDIDGGRCILPTMQFKGHDGGDFLSSFASGLERAGFKSNEFKQTHEEISAIKYHLEDMRKIVFKIK